MTGFVLSSTDLEAVRRLQAGDREAVAHVYHSFSRAVFTLAARTLNNDGLAAEVTQDVFVDAYQKAGTLRDPAAFGGWLKRMTVNRCLSVLRSAWESRKDAFGDDGYGADALEGAPATDVGTVRDLEWAMAQLTPMARMVVWLYDVEGWTHKEIAEETGNTISFSKSQLARAHQRLRDLLASPSDLEDEVDHGPQTGQPAAGGGGEPPGRGLAGCAPAGPA